MKKIWLAIGLLSAVPAAFAQPPSAPAGGTGQPGGGAAQATTFLPLSDLNDRIAKFAAAQKNGKHASNELLTAGPYHGVLQYLDAPMKIYATHEDADELFVVLDGSGTMVIGAKLVNPHQGQGATTTVADSGEGGTPHRIAKGDMFIVPVHSSRSVTAVDGTLVMMSMRLPHPDAATGSAP